MRTFASLPIRSDVRGTVVHRGERELRFGEIGVQALLLRVDFRERELLQGAALAADRGIDTGLEHGNARRERLDALRIAGECRRDLLAQCDQTVTAAVRLGERVFQTAHRLALRPQALVVLFGELPAHEPAQY